MPSVAEQMRVAIANSKRVLTECILLRGVVGKEPERWKFPGISIDYHVNGMGRQCCRCIGKPLQSTPTSRASALAHLKGA